MWQQNPFPVLTGATEFQSSESLEQQAHHLQSFLFRNNNPSSSFSSPSSSNFPNLILSSELVDWQRIAGLVQSPASANSEGSSTSTPESQCPASPALTFCEMPSSRNGGCSSSSTGAVVNSEMIMQHKSSAANTVWPGLETQAPGPGPGSSSSAMCLTTAPLMTRVSSDCGKLKHWHVVTPEMPQQTAVETPGGAPSFFSEDWNSLLSHSESLASPMPSQLLVSSGTSCSYDRFRGADHQQVKKEEEYFLGGRDGLIIDQGVLSLQSSSSSSLSSALPHQPGLTSSSKIGSFMDLLRQSDRPISDATAATAAATSQLGHLLSCAGQGAPEMWITHSSRLPATLSEVLPSTSSGGGGEAALEQAATQKNKRKLFECGNNSSSPMSELVDVQETRGSAAVQQHHGPRVLLLQDEDEGMHEPAAPAANDKSELFPKKPRIENSNFPFKMQVRKEKLGERISALQQLVSPFGKTDTASVLLEAIGYIKFLHEQVQVLSSPYMKHSGPTPSKLRHTELQSDEGKQDLRSRGLCLVPISCTLHLANDNGADYWTPTLHGGLK